MLVNDICLIPNENTNANYKILKLKKEIFSKAG